MEKVKGVGWGPHQELINDLLPMKLSFQTNVSILSLSLSVDICQVVNSLINCFTKPNSNPGETGNSLKKK